MSNKTIPVSCTVIACNEGDRIGKTLASVVDLVDEILVIDSGSTDNTIEVVKSFGAKVIHKDWSGYGPQKRFAEIQAEHDWILNLDADEVLSQKLQDEIKQWRAKPDPQFSGYRFHQTTIYPGRDKPRPFADFHNYIRLYDRREMRFHESLVHDTVDARGKPIGNFKGECWHWSWRSLDHLAKKLDTYTTLQAKELRKPQWVLLLRRPIEYPVLLFRYLFLKRHITGGWYGIKAAHTLAKGRAARMRKILDEQRAERIRE